MQKQLNKIQKLCQDISRKENGLHYASYHFYGHTDEIKVTLSERDDETHKPFLIRNIYLTNEYQDFIGISFEEQLQNLINDLKCYL